MAKAAQLHDLKIDELSLVFAKKDGSEWAPRNQEARVLAVKGGEKNLGAKLVEAVKSYFSNDYSEPTPWPVAEAVDNIDKDGDGPEDYNEIAFAIGQVYYDIQQAFSISDNKARSAAIVGCIDSFISGLDAMRSGAEEEEKAGARHSEADREHLDKILAAQTGIGEHVAAIQGALRHLGITSAQGQNKEDEGPEEDGGGPDNSQVDDDADKAGEAVEPEDKPEEKAGEIEMTQEEIAALVDAAVAKATAANAEKNAAEVAAAKAESEAAVAAAKAEAQSAKAEAVKAAQQAEEDRELLRALAGNSQKTSSLSAAVAAQKSSRLQSRMVEEMRNNPESPVI